MSGLRQPGAGLRRNIIRVDQVLGLSSALTAINSSIVEIGADLIALSNVVDSKEPAIAAGVAGQYWTGSKTWATLDKSAVGLSAVDNTSDMGKPVSTAQATAIALKVDASALAGATGAAMIGAANFDGDIIPDNSNAQQAIQSLETFLSSPVFPKASTTGQARFHGIGENPNEGWPSLNSPSGNIFQYLDNGGMIAGGKPGANIALSGYARTSDTYGTAAEVAIGVAGFAYSDKTNEGDIGPAGNGPGSPVSVAGGWAIYGTAYRVAGAYGAMHALELDIAEAGDVVPIFPGAINGIGGRLVSNGIQLASGGEATATAGLVKTASSAISILSNDQNRVANFEKGIVFDRYAIDGTDGVTGSGIAMAFSTGHHQSWFDISNNQVGSIGADVDATAASWTKAVFSSGGFFLTKGLDGGVLFQVDPVADAEAYIAATAFGAGGAPRIEARGIATDIDIYAQPKGAGLFGITYAVEFAGTPGSFSPAYHLAIKDGTGSTFYIPAAAVAW